MKFFSRLSTVAALLLACVATQAAVLSTNLPTNGVYLMSTNRASVYSVEITAAANAQLEFYDSSSLAAPYYGTNYVNSAYTNRSTYSTNYVYSYVGYNGYTNWYTNAGVWTLNNAVAANTNVLPVMIGAVVAGGTYAVYNTDALFANGIAVRCIGTNVAVVVNYRSGGP